MSKTKIVIVGGGFGGVFTAKYLYKYGKQLFDIELISSQNYFVFQPLLPEVAAGTINAQDAVTPLRLMLPGIKIRQAEVKSVDFNNNTVTILQGRKRILQTISYDHVVLAGGQITDLSFFTGFEQHSLCMKNLSDAYHLRNHVIKCLELADVTKIEAVKKQFLTFVVAGGGFSGVETMGELMEMIHRSLKYYPNISKEDIRAVIIQRDNRILMEMSPKLSAYTHKDLEKRGVEILLETGVKSATANAVYTSDGRSINTNTIVTTIGNGPSAFAKSLGVELVRGKIPTKRTLQLDGHEHVWSLGDAALIPMDDSESPRYAPPTAQFARQQAKVLAKNLVKMQQGKKLNNFDYKPKGIMASLGNYTGVAEIYGIKIKGLIAWCMWRGLYIGMLPTMVTKIRVGFNWIFDYIMPRTIVQLAHAQESATKYLHYAKGDVLYEQGQVLDGFYTVISGSLEMRNEAEGFSKTIKAGEHWGERIIQKDLGVTGTLTALEDTVVLRLKRADFVRLRNSLPALDSYFDSIDDSKYSKQSH